MRYGYYQALALCILMCSVAVANESERCSCQKPPKTDTRLINETQSCPDTTTVHQADVPVCNYHADEKCPCNNKPRSEDTTLCPCNNKPRLDDATLCPCNNKPRLDDTTLCPCNNKPRSDDTNLCSCGKPKPHKEPVTGAELFISGTHAIMNCVEGGIISHNTGNLKEGLPYIMEGITALANLTSRSADPEKAYQDLYKFITSLNQKDLDNLLQTARKHTITPVPNS